MKKLQSDKNLSIQARIDAELYKLLKIKAAKESTTVKALLDACAVKILEDETIQN